MTLPELVVERVSDLGVPAVVFVEDCMLSSVVVDLEVESEVSKVLFDIEVDFEASDIVVEFDNEVDNVVVDVEFRYDEGNTDVRVSPTVGAGVEAIDVDDGWLSWS